MDRNYSICGLPDATAEVAAALADPAFADVEAQPQTGRYGREYYLAVHGSAMTVHSFVVHWQGKPIVLALCTLLEGVLGLHGLPMRMFVRSGLDPDVERGAVKAAFLHLDTLGERIGVQEFWLRQRAGSMLDAIGTAALNREGASSAALIGVVDLLAGPAEWKRALRKSFNQFVNWGKRSFAITYVNAEAPVDLNFDRYREFHARIAGRVTRPKASWDVMQRHVAEGRGELLLAEMDGSLVAGSLFIDGTEVTIYMNGVYDRDLTKPLAHYLIWHGIERAHQRGMRLFHLGDVHQIGRADDKRYSVGYFKRGFATGIQTWLDWRWPSKTASTEA